jgi:hypothetical protein
MSKTELFLQLEHELDIYRKMMTQATDVILSQDVTKYPIMVAHQQELEIGIPLTNEDHPNPWNIHASTLEEFVQRQIIFPDKIDEFKKNYKDTYKFVCVFVLSELGAQFIFLPRKKA